ncbi:MAG: 2-dehydro-3-deoxyglucarate aldolase [Burkholderiales bacterium]|jgi:2-keto-3-deoxy-L-rhamnonate aldolase RhmA|nr:2-dehydro-3-deoxyglucarate aldolase [Burkholderiales bacterium]
MNPFRQMLDSAGSDAPLGSWIMSASPIVAEAMGCAGFAWGVLDMEHTPLDLMDLVHMLQGVASTPMLPVVRVPWNDTVTVKRVLDAGAATLLFPFVQNADEARRAVAAARYPPQGVRGMAGMSRGSRFGTNPNHFKTANQQVSVIVQLETPAAVAQLEAIAAVEGVDALFLGPGDLSGAMGHVGNVTHPEVMDVMSRCAQRCRAIGKPVGTVGGTPEVVSQYRAMGYTFVAIASDLGLLMRAAQAAVKTLAAPQGQTLARAGGDQTQPGGY